MDLSVLYKCQVFEDFSFLVYKVCFSLIIFCRNRVPTIFNCHAMWLEILDLWKVGCTPLSTVYRFLGQSLGSYLVISHSALCIKLAWTQQCMNDCILNNFNETSAEGSTLSQAPGD